MTIYLDLCCFNRPFDDQSAMPIYLETEAKLAIQENIKDGREQLIWSFMMDFENSANTDAYIQESIFQWRAIAAKHVSFTDTITGKALEISSIIKGKKDAIHLACAIHAKADCFITVDKGILRKKEKIKEINILNPVEYIMSEEDRR